MKSNDYLSTYPAARGIPAAVLLATMALASPAGAASVDRGQDFMAVGKLPAYVILAEATLAKATGPATAVKPSKVDRVEARIKDLHAKLNITPAQEQQWNTVTQVMRDNAIKMDALTAARSENAKIMSAIDNLKSYGEIAELHEDGIKKFIPVFTDLYDSMSVGQKKDADVIFRSYGHQKASDNTVLKND
jgi:hypothetical protein